MLLNADNRTYAVDAYGAILAVVDGYRLRLCKGDSVAHSLAILNYWRNAGNVVVLLHSVEEGLHRCYIAVHLLA